MARKAKKASKAKKGLKKGAKLGSTKTLSAMKSFHSYSS